MFSDLLDAAVGSSDVELDAEVRASELELRRLQARRAALVAVSQARGSFRFEGHRSVASYLRGTCNVSNAEAARWRRLATVCDAAPMLGDALMAGRVGVDQILEIGRIHTNPRTREYFAAVAPIYLERAEHCTHADLRSEVDSFLNLADQDGAFADLASNVEGRHASMHAVAGGLDVSVSGGDPIVTAEVIAAFEWFCQRQFRADVDARRDLHGDNADQFPLARTARQRRFDAFVAMVRGAAAHGDGAAPAKIVVNLIGQIEDFNNAAADVDLVIHRDTHTTTSSNVNVNDGAGDRDNAADTDDLDADSGSDNGEDSVNVNDRVDDTNDLDADNVHHSDPVHNSGTDNGEDSVDVNDRVDDSVGGDHDATTENPDDDSDSYGDNDVGGGDSKSVNHDETEDSVNHRDGDDVGESDGDDGVYRFELDNDDIDAIISAAGSDPTGWVDRRCQTSTGIPIHPKLLLQAAITGHIRRVVLDSRGVVIDYGRTQRLFPGHARDAAKLLVTTCEFFGCNVSTTFAQIDHLDEWQAGGRTDQANAGAPCGTHNRYKTAKRWSVRRDPLGRKFHIRPDGTAVLPVGARQPDFTIDEQHQQIRQRLQDLQHTSA